MSLCHHYIVMHMFSPKHPRLHCWKSQILEANIWILSSINLHSSIHYIPYSHWSFKRSAAVSGITTSDIYVYRCPLYVYIFWDAPPPSDSSKWRSIRIPKHNNPGGDCYWVEQYPKKNGKDKFSWSGRLYKAKHSLNFFVFYFVLFSRGFLGFLTTSNKNLAKTKKQKQKKKD